MLVTKQTLEVFREYGRKTNPVSSEKLRALKLLAIDCKFEKFKKKIDVGDIVYSINDTPINAISNIYTNVKMKNDQVQLKSDELEIIRINPKYTTDTNGNKKTVFAFLLSNIKTDFFIDYIDSCLQFGGENLSDEEKQSGLNPIPFIMNKTRGDPVNEKIYKKAEWLNTTFGTKQYVFVRREIRFLDDNGENKSIACWFFTGMEFDSYAVEAKNVADEFGVLPFISASGVTEIIHQ